VSTVQGRAATRLYSGSALVAQRIGAWFAPEERPVAATIRCGGALWAGAHFGPGLLDHGPLLAAASVCWCWAAWRAKPIEDKSEQDGEAESPQHTVEEIRTGVHQLLHAAVAGRNGVHLSELLDTLQQAGLLGAEVTLPELRRALDRWGIPTRDSLKVAGLNRAGVHRDDLPPLPEPLPQPVLADAG
jgi:hypothetical protein